MDLIMYSCILPPKGLFLSEISAKLTTKSVDLVYCMITVGREMLKKRNKYWSVKQINAAGSSHAAYLKFSTKDESARIK